MQNLIPKTESSIFQLVKMSKISGQTRVVPTEEQFIASSIKRFGNSSTYIWEKIHMDVFVLKGNLEMICGLREYIEENYDQLQKQKEIKILDVGPAIGAMSSLLTLQLLDEYNLFDKAKIYFNDVSKKVIKKTQKGNFEYPTEIVKPSLKEGILKKFKKSEAFLGSTEKSLWPNQYFDIILTCYLFHHLHDSIKVSIAKEITRLLKPNGFLGVAEEWFPDYQENKVTLSHKAIISCRDLKQFFQNLDIFFVNDKSKSENFYTFCAKK